MPIHFPYFIVNIFLMRILTQMRNERVNKLGLKLKKRL